MISASLLLIVFINFSTISTKYICVEKTSSNIPNKLIINIEKYHHWANIWSNSNGKLSYDIPTKESGTYRHIVQKENLLHIYNNQGRMIQGTYSDTTSKLFLKTKNSSFEGKCIIINTHCDNNLTH